MLGNDMTPGNSATEGSVEGLSIFCFFAELLLYKMSDIGGSGLTEACCICWSIADILLRCGSSFGENMAVMA